MTETLAFEPLERDPGRHRGTHGQRVAVAIAILTVLVPAGLVVHAIHAHDGRARAARERAVTAARQAAVTFVRDLAARAPTESVSINAPAASSATDAQISYVTATQAAPGRPAVVSFRSTAAYGASYSAASVITLCFQTTITYAPDSTATATALDCSALPPLGHGPPVIEPAP